MPDDPSGQLAPPAPREPPPPAPSPPAQAAAPHRGDVLRKRLLQKKVIRPAALAAVAVLAGVLALILYPSRTQLPAPTYTTLQLVSPFAVEAVNYAVYQEPAVAKVEIWVLYTDGQNASRPPAGQRAALFVFPPIGTTFATCPAHLCFASRDGTSYWEEHLTFRQAVGPSILPDVNGPGMYASFDLYLKSSNYGAISDGATAAAALPKLLLYGNTPGQPNLLTRYRLQAANTYDWPTFPPAFSDSTSAEWLEQMTSPGDIPDLEATGVNHGVQAQDNDLTFLAGALVGVAGGALLGAIQEALHASD